MIPRTLLTSLNYKKLISLSGLFFRRPLMVIPTIKATKNCIRISDHYFPNLHHLNNSSNAFRHALWNILLTKEAYQWNKDFDEALQWAKTITDWHEEFSPNKPLERAMDLHNNAYGRTFVHKMFKRNNIIETDSEKLAKELLQFVTTSKKVSNLNELSTLKNQLVHLI
ncbi:DUF6973 domain-containing protein [Zhouia amylolytica]|uniref:DUF6973 domain-containing protein n=1 Tax=Zhouia amylolytica TaxID=376730 RepID=UPI003B8A6794